MNSSVLRVLDANANRAREALRVVEDYARFCLGSSVLQSDLKRLRHDLTTALKEIVPSAIPHRDTPGDVGMTAKVESELRRADLAEVVTAAGKRLGEALRAIEEFAKIDHPAAAAGAEGIRYRFYEVEQRVARTLRPTERFAGVRLCVLITESACRRPWLEVAEEAILGGADCLQLREKAMEGGELLRRAKDLAALCRRHGVISIINDRPDVAVLAGADGVHVGQGDLPATEVRKIVGPGGIVGVSTHAIEQAWRAVEDGADYLGVGPVYKSATKPRDFVAGLEYARRVAREIPQPGLAIAGINEGNVEEVAATGISGIAVTAAVTGCEDVRGAAARLKQKLSASTHGDGH